MSLISDKLKGNLSLEGKIKGVLLNQQRAIMSRPREAQLHEFTQLFTVMAYLLLLLNDGALYAILGCAFGNL